MYMYIFTTYITKVILLLYTLLYILIYDMINISIPNIFFVYDKRKYLASHFHFRRKLLCILVLPFVKILWRNLFIHTKYTCITNVIEWTPRGAGCLYYYPEIVASMKANLSRASASREQSSMLYLSPLPRCWVAPWQSTLATQRRRAAPPLKRTSRHVCTGTCFILYCGLSEQIGDT